MHINPTGWTNVHVHTASSERPASLSPSLPHFLAVAEKGKHRLLPAYDAHLQRYRELHDTAPL